MAIDESRLTEALDRFVRADLNPQGCLVLIQESEGWAIVWDGLSTPSGRENALDFADRLRVAIRQFIISLEAPKAEERGRKR